MSSISAFILIKLPNVMRMGLMYMIVLFIIVVSDVCDIMVLSDVCDIMVLSDICDIMVVSDVCACDFYTKMYH